MSRADLLMAASVPALLVAGLLPWHTVRMCTTAGCGTLRATGWTGSPAWAAVLLAGLLVAGLWVLSLPGRGRVPTGLALLAATVAVLAAAVVVTTLDALLFGRPGAFHFRLPVVAEFPVLSVRPGAGLFLGLAGLLLQAAAGWLTLRRRKALVSPLHPPGLAAPPPAGGFAAGPPARRSRHR